MNPEQGLLVVLRRYEKRQISAGDDEAAQLWHSRRLRASGLLGNLSHRANLERDRRFRG
jgi:hypothetical protein